MKSDEIVERFFDEFDLRTEAELEKMEKNQKLRILIKLWRAIRGKENGNT